MQYRLVFLLAPLLLVTLAGCTGPTIPDLAVAVHDERIPGAVLHAWVEEDGGAILFHGVFQFDGRGYVQTREGEWPRPWLLEIRDTNGTALVFHDRELFRDFFYETMVAGSHKEFQYTWQRQVYAPNGTVDLAPAGLYTAVVGFSIGLPHRVDLNATLEFTLPEIA